MFSTTRHISSPWRALAGRSARNERFQQVIRDPSARREQLQAAMTDALRALVAQKITEGIMSLPSPANGLLLMTERELSLW